MLNRTVESKYFSQILSKYQKVSKMTLEDLKFHSDVLSNHIGKVFKNNEYFCNRLETLELRNIIFRWPGEDDSVV